jgi:hypothetical protein
MSIIVGKNNRAEDGPVVPPDHPLGESWPLCMYYRDGLMVAFADSYEELLYALIPGYQDMAPEEQAYQRIRLAQGAAAQIQGRILAQIERQTVSDADWEVLVAPRGETQPRADWWTNEIPLVVVETSYEPFTDVPRPASGLNSDSDDTNLWWVRPGDEDDFLVSLHEIGYVRLMQAAPAL